MTLLIQDSKGNMYTDSMVTIIEGSVEVGDVYHGKLILPQHLSILINDTVYPIEVIATAGDLTHTLLNALSTGTGDLISLLNKVVFSNINDLGVTLLVRVIGLPASQVNTVTHRADGGWVIQRRKLNNTGYHLVGSTYLYATFQYIIPNLSPEEYLMLHSYTGLVPGVGGDIHCIMHDSDVPFIIPVASVDDKFKVKVKSLVMDSLAGYLPKSAKDTKEKSKA